MERVQVTLGKSSKLQETEWIQSLSNSSFLGQNSLNFFVTSVIFFTVGMEMGMRNPRSAHTSLPMSQNAIPTSKLLDRLSASQPTPLAFSSPPHRLPWGACGHPNLHCSCEGDAITLAPHPRIFPPGSFPRGVPLGLKEKINEKGETKILQVLEKRHLLWWYAPYEDNKGILPPGGLPTGVGLRLVLRET